ncbi:MAG: hypothetical protein MK105_00960 [Crocinitomicaceae bacterium]|nr:hypothetical protein [Crocinitomicaceae bacterium]
MNANFEVLFVYNAEKQVVSAAFGFLHKLFSPDTYPCELCLITHSGFGERKSWAKLKAESGLDLCFMYRSEFELRFNQNIELPAVFVLIENVPITIMSKSELARLKEPEELIHLLNLKLQTI